jgi:hypothetical protein
LLRRQGLKHWRFFGLRLRPLCFGRLFSQSRLSFFLALQLQPFLLDIFQAVIVVLVLLKVLNDLLLSFDFLA